MTLTAPVPDTGFYRQMAVGHMNRTGHALNAHLESNGDGLWHLIRQCCTPAANESGSSATQNGATP
jgi:hypothetical protein